MNKRIISSALALGVVTLTMSGCNQRRGDGLSQAEQFDPQTKVVSGLIFYYGVVEAATVRGHPPDHSEAAMHEGPPASLASYHIVLTLFEAASNKRVVDARVAVRLGRLNNSSGKWQPMDAMRDTGSESFGRYVELPDAGRYRIEFQVNTATMPKPVTARFLFERPE